MSDEKEMTFLEHLEELRKRLLICIVVVAILFVICYIFSQEIFSIIVNPFVEATGKKNLVFLSPVEGFITYLKVSFFSAVIIASPLIIYEFWAFVSPALYSHEKKVVLPALIASTIFFSGGVLFAYSVILPIAFRYLITGFSTEWLSPMISMERYLSFSFTLILAFGVVFDTPVILLLLNRLGIIYPSHLRKYRGAIIVSIFALSAILTPPDVISQILLSFPLILLFELAILAMRLIGKEET